MGGIGRFAKISWGAVSPGRDSRPFGSASLFPGSRVHLGWRSLWLTGFFLLASAASLAVDGPLACWLAGHELPAAVRKLLQLSELFGHGIGILLIGLVIFQLDPIRRWAVPRVLLISIGSGVAADVVKVLVGRLRPRYCSLEGGISAVIQGWFTLAGEGKSQSFPSGHAAAAVGLALALAALYPRGRWLFPAMAFLASCQRLDEGAHFLSDLLAGAAIGSLLAALCLHFRLIASLFDRREALWRSLAGPRITQSTLHPGSTDPDASPGANMIHWPFPVQPLDSRFGAGLARRFRPPPAARR
jgi:membrane-associated phospholipid phosphatase